jgi:translation initiation factor 2 beta subunit (eIF-2beta)/eIF-5
MINIGGDKNDKFYRYKRDVVCQLVVGKKIKIVNLYKISQQLVGNFSDQAENVFNALVRTLRKKLSLNIKVEKKTNHVIVHGRVFVQTIEDIIEEFTSKYILCPKCNLPEWNGNTCTACGHNR